MEDDGGIRKLVELVFGKKDTVNEKILKPQNSSIPTFLLTEDFLERFNCVLYVSKLNAIHKWEGFFDANSRHILSTHMNYMIFIMAACLNEHKNNQNIFDSFISVCSLVITFNQEILQKTGVDFSELNSDIFMVFYRNVLKRSFHRRRDFIRFEEYIRGHKYIKWIKKHLPLSTDPCHPAIQKVEFVLNIAEDLIKNLEVPSISFTIEGTGVSLAQEVLANTSVELPSLPNEPDLIGRLVASRKRIAITREVEAVLTSETLNVVSQCQSSSKFDSKPNYAVKHQDSSARYENIIQAVIRHNHSKNSSKGRVDSKKKEVVRILEHLKNSIESLIEVLDKHDTE